MALSYGWKKRGNFSFICQSECRTAGPTDEAELPGQVPQRLAHRSVNLPPPRILGSQKDVFARGRFAAWLRNVPIIDLTANETILLGGQAKSASYVIALNNLWMCLCAHGHLALKALLIETQNECKYVAGTPSRIRILFNPHQSLLCMTLSPAFKCLLSICRTKHECVMPGRRIQSSAPFLVLNLLTIMVHQLLATPNRLSDVWKCWKRWKFWQAAGRHNRPAEKLKTGNWWP